MIKRSIPNRVHYIEPNPAVNIRGAVSRNKRVSRNVEVVSADGVPQPRKLVNFFLELVLPVILKELKSNFSFLLYVYFKNCHINKLDNYFIYLVLAYFLEFF